MFCLIPVHVLFRNIFALFWNRSSSKRNKSGIALSCFIPDYLLYSGTDLSKIRPIARWFSLVKAVTAWTNASRLDKWLWTESWTIAVRLEQMLYYEDIKVRSKRRWWGYDYIHAPSLKRTPDQVTRPSALTKAH